MIFEENGVLVREYDNEILWIEPCGNDSLRVRSSPKGILPNESGALLDRDFSDVKSKINIYENNEGEITNGDITAYITNRNQLIFKNKDGKVILEEFIRLRAVAHDFGDENSDAKIIRGFSSTLKLASREFKPNIGGDYSVKVRFESNPNEKIYGMGQYQQSFLNLKNCVLELAHRNSQISVPFYISSEGYGFLWNNPAVGEVKFAKNLTEWSSQSTDYIDYWITVGDKPSKIIENYAKVSGTPPKMPKELLGLWQSKLRYQTQEEVMNVAKEYKKRGITPSVLVIDYFHWTEQGDYEFDKNYWPEPSKMVSELEEMGIKTMISIWPTVSQQSKYYNDYLEGGHLVKVNRGIRVTMPIFSNAVYIDPTNKKTREFLWDKLKRNYYDCGIKLFWLDVAEPGYSVYDFDNYQYLKGSALKIGNTYPVEYSKIVHDGLKSEGIDDIVTLIRGTWAGGQKYGTLAWSGDIDSSFKALKNQVNTGLNMSIAGNPWWTTDIGGFHGGNIHDDEFKELMIRWFQYATFSPILRMHGDRHPHTPALGKDGGGILGSGAGNEIWSYGQECEDIFVKYIKIREYLIDYMDMQFNVCHKSGTPIMRPLFYDFPNDKTAWEVEDMYMLGEDILVVPVMNYKQDKVEIYLPEGCKWKLAYSDELFDGGQKIVLEVDITKMPVFFRESADATMMKNIQNIYN